MPVSPMLSQSTCWLASKPQKHKALCNTQRLQEISAPESACGGVETLLAEENNILQHKHRQQQQKQKKSALCVSFAHGQPNLLAISACMDFWTKVPVIALCKLQHRQTNNKQRQKLSLSLAGFSLLSGRGGIGLFGGNHVVSWAVTVLPCTRHACICTLRFQTSLHAQTMQVRKKHKQQFFSVCVMVSHCSVAEEALDPFVGTMLSRCQSQL